MAVFCTMLWGDMEAQDTTKGVKPPTQLPSQVDPKTQKPSVDPKAPSVDTTKLAAEKKLQDSIMEMQIKAAAKAACDTCRKKLSDSCNVKINKPGALADPLGSWTLVLIPLILFGVIIGTLFKKLGDFSLQEALTENEYVKKTIKNPEYTATAATTLAGTGASASVNTILPPTIDITDISNNAIASPGILEDHIKDKKLKLAQQLINDKADNDKEQLLINALPDADPSKPVKQTALDAKITNDKLKNDQIQTEIDELIILASELPTTPRASSSRFIALVTSLLTLVVAVCLCSFFIYFYIATGTPPDIGKFSSVLLALGIGVIPYAFNKVAAAISSNKSTTDE